MIRDPDLNRATTITGLKVSVYKLKETKNKQTLSIDNSSIFRLSRLMIAIIEKGIRNCIEFHQNTVGR